MEVKRRIWEIFSEAFEKIRAAHASVGGLGHHDIFHAARVGEKAYQIAQSDWQDERLAELAGLAGLCHNADRILAHAGDVSREGITGLITSWIQGEDLSPQELQQVIEAVLQHSQRNGADDSRIQIALMDADRVINLDLDIVMRSAQHYHELPTVDLGHYTAHPEARYNHPKSVLRDIAYCLDWVTPGSGVCVRTASGSAMANVRAARLRRYIDELEEELREEGILPSPF